MNVVKPQLFRGETGMGRVAIRLARRTGKPSQAAGILVKTKP